MKKLMLVLALGIIFLCGATAQANSILLTDVFDSFNADLWVNASHDGGWANVESGYLDLGTTGGVRFGRGKAISVFNLSGDFNTYVDYDIASLNDFYGSVCMYVFATDGSFGMRIGETYQYDGLKYLESSYHIDSYWQGNSAVLNNDMTGKFRMERSGNYLGAYYFSGGDWVLAGGTILPYNSDVNVVFEAGNNGMAGNAPHVNAHYDNFYAYADNITNVDAKYLNTSANPEPGTFILLGTGLLGLGAINRMRRKR
jgi:hypothetical protein